MKYIFLLFLVAFVNGRSWEGLLLQKRSTCSNSDEVGRSFTFGYINDGGKTDENKRKVYDAINEVKSWLMASKDRQAYRYTKDNIVGYVWAGSMVQNSGAANNGFKNLIYELDNWGMPNMFYIEYVNGNPMHGWGAIFDQTGNLGRVQEAVKLWSAGQSVKKFANRKTYQSQSLCYLSYSGRKNEGNDGEAGTCFYVKIASGKTAADQTGVPGEYLKVYNDHVDFTKLVVGQPICYTLGSLPSFKPSQKSNHECYDYLVQKGDSCSALAAQYYPLSVADIENYNKKTYGWSGCKNLQANTKMCLSDGTPMRPKSNPLAECGPLAPAELYLKACPLNACCSQFGFCGLTSEFCDTNQKCYSNCGLPGLPSGSSNSFVSSAFWLDDGTSINDGEYDIVYYAFGLLSSDLQSIKVGPGFSEFKQLEYSKKVLSLGGWDFSTSPSTYEIFRKAILSSNRPSVGKVISDFVKENGLDGVNFDWEYPGEQDISGIPAGSSTNGPDYSGLVQTVRNNLGGNYLTSVAIPASFWYLKNFPISTFNQYVSYFVFMNYDYVGQWDYGKANTGIGCHTDKTFTTDAVKMLIKAGVSPSKIHGGLGNYGRSYKLSHQDCTNYKCSFTGPSSGASPGKNSNTPGILYEYEIDELTGSKSFNSTSKCYSLVYNSGNEWVSWMDKVERENLVEWYKSMGFGGSALWAYNYEKHSDNDDNAEDGDYDDENSVDFIDLYDCENNANQLGESIFGCMYEDAVNFIIQNGTDAIDLVRNILDDYDNYIEYYEAYTRSIYDFTSDKYFDWLFGHRYADKSNPFNKYYKEDNEHADITPPNEKRDDYAIIDSENYRNAETEYISFNLSDWINDNSHESGDGGDDEDYIDGNLLGPNPPTPINYFVVTDKEGLVKEFNENNPGFNITVESLVQRDKRKRIYHLDQTFIFYRSTILDSYVLFPNVLKNVTQDNILDVENLISFAKKKLYTESAIDIYETIESVLVFSEIAEIAKVTYDEGKIQKANYEKAKKLKIVEIVFSILGVVTLFLGPAAEIATIVVDIARIIAVSAINDDIDAVDLASSLLGLFSPIFTAMKVGVADFKELNSYIKSSRALNRETLDNFKYIKDIRNQLNIGKSCSI